MREAIYASADLPNAPPQDTGRRTRATTLAWRPRRMLLWGFRSGLGGFGERSKALEQIGTDADCTRFGSAVYSTWYELVPAAPITLKLKVHAGDAMVASVTVKDHDVTLRIRDLSTGKMFTRTRRVSRIDSSSAEWIVEAPSVCVPTNICRTLTLTDFGSVAFSDLSATAGGQTG